VWCAIEDSPHFASLRDYLEEQVMQQISDDQFTKLRDEVKLAVKACDEMNEVTTALRPTEGLYFEVDLTSTVPLHHYTERTKKMPAESIMRGVHTIPGKAG